MPSPSRAARRHLRRGRHGCRSWSPCAVAELRVLVEPEIERASARAVALISSHGDDALSGGSHRRVLRADGEETALGIHACVRPHSDCPGDAAAPTPFQKEE